MQETIAQVFGYVWAVWRYRWLVILVAWVLAIVGWVVVWRVPVAYVATAQVFVDTNTVLRPLLKGLAITPDIEQRVAMMSRTLLSRPNLEKLSRMTDLDLQVVTEADQEKMIAGLADSISLAGTRGNASIYQIEARNRDRDLARRIVQSLITVFIEGSLNEKREDSSGAQSFLDEQIAEYERRLVEAENRLARFKQRNVDVLVGSDGDYYTRLQLARSALEQARLELREAENRRVELQRQLDGESPMLPSSAGAGMTSPVDSRIQSLRFQLDQLLTRYTDKHPEVRQLRGLITDLEREKAESLDQLNQLARRNAGSLATSPVYQGMRAMLTESEARVAELQVRVGEYERRVEELESKVNSIPEVEAQLKQLDRDYNVIATQYQEIVQRRESARLSQDVEENANDVTFRVIDPPYVPLQPSEPNKFLLNAAVLVASLGAGLGLALLLSLLNPIVTDARTLATLAGVPLLGIVTLKQSAQEARRDTLGLLGFAVCTLCLLFAFAGITLAPKLF